MTPPQDGRAFPRPAALSAVSEVAGAEAAMEDEVFKEEDEEGLDKTEEEMNKTEEEDSVNEEIRKSVMKNKMAKKMQKILFPEMKTDSVDSLESSAGEIVLNISKKVEDAEVEKEETAGKEEEKEERNMEENSPLVQEDATLEPTTEPTRPNEPTTLTDPTTLATVPATTLGPTSLATPGLATRRRSVRAQVASYSPSRA